jgi:hypothetical protein
MRHPSHAEEKSPGRLAGALQISGETRHLGLPCPAHLPLPKRRALALVAKLPEATQGLLLAYGIKDEVIAKLIAGRLVTAWTEHIGGSSCPVEITRIAITEAGRAALNERL